jgi:hypothetical protein
MGASIPVLLREDACSDKAEAASFTEFLKNVVDVNFDGAWTQPQVASHILVGQTATDQKRDFASQRLSILDRSFSGADIGTHPPTAPKTIIRKQELSAA